jgi:hypothetical protein
MNGGFTAPQRSCNMFAMFTYALLATIELG